MEFQVGTLLRIFLGEEDRRDGQPLFSAVVDELRAAGFTGATVLKGIEGYGARRLLRTARAVELASSLPVVVEVVDEDAKIQAFLPTLHAMIGHGLLTLERINLLRIDGATLETNA